MYIEYIHIGKKYTWPDVQKECDTQTRPTESEKRKNPNAYRGLPHPQSLSVLFPTKPSPGYLIIIPCIKYPRLLDPKSFLRLPENKVYCLNFGNPEYNLEMSSRIQPKY